MNGKKLKNLRIKKGITQEALGEILNLSKKTISAYENNLADPSTDTLFKIADYFGVPADSLKENNGLDPSIADTHRRIESALSDDQDAEELLSFWKELKEREDLFLLFKQVRPLSNDSIRRVIRVIKAIEAEEEAEFNR